MQVALAAGLAESTRASYARIWRRFQNAVGEEVADDVGREERGGVLLARFAASRLAAGLRVGTAKQELAAIRHVASARAGRDPAALVDRILRGYENIERMTRPRLAQPDGRVGRQVPPLGARELKAMRSAAKTADERTLADHACVAYSAALRAAEHVAGAGEAGHALTWDRVMLDHEQGPHLRLGWIERRGGRTKTAPSAIGTLGKADGVDGAAILRRKHAVVAPGAAGPVFTYMGPGTHPDGTLGRAGFTIRLRSLARKAGLPRAAEYTGHSLRAGRATDLLRDGVPHHLIMKACRWRSATSLLRYERLAAGELRRLTRTDQAGVERGRAKEEEEADFE